MGEELSEYERQRLENIRQNELELKRLGLLLPAITKPIQVLPRKRVVISARKNKSKTADGEAIKAVPVAAEPLRRSSRLASQSLGTKDESDQRLDFSVSHRIIPKKRRRTISNQKSTTQSKPSSIKNLRVDVKKLKGSIGKCISPVDGQVKRAAMEFGSQTTSSVTPTFSRMSGIQEWKNCIFLFVNVYGEDYKNVFLSKGRQITWFAQNRQREDTPVIQKMVHMEGGVVEEEIEDGNEVQMQVETYTPTPVCLFCREKGKGYVYCGNLTYVAHDPSRIPIRFVWSLVDIEILENSKEFASLIKAADELNQERMNSM